MRRRLPRRRGIALNVGLAETIDALVLARWIEHADIELDRLADPVRQAGVIGEIVVGERMDQGPQPRVFDRCHNISSSVLEEMHFILRDRMRADAALGHLANEQDQRPTGDKPITQSHGRRAIFFGIIDVSVERRARPHAALSPCSFRHLASFFKTMSRFRRDKWSMNSTPLR